MTKDEARIVGRIIATADGGCSTCVGLLEKTLVAAFPEHKEVFDQAIRYELDENDRDIAVELGLPATRLDW